MHLSSLDRLANLVPIVAWCLLPVGGLALPAHVAAGLVSLLLLHAAARIALALMLGVARAQFLSSTAPLRALENRGADLPSLPARCDHWRVARLKQRKRSSP